MCYAIFHNSVLQFWKLLFSIRMKSHGCQLIGGWVYDSNFNSLRPRQNGRHFADDILECIFLNENVWISPEISLKFVHGVRINNIPALVQIIAWRRPGDKPLSESMMVSLLTHICVTRPQWVKSVIYEHMLRIKFMSTFYHIKLLSDECYRTSMKVSQHWFR